MQEEEDFIFLHMKTFSVAKFILADHFSYRNWPFSVVKQTSTDLVICPKLKKFKFEGQDSQK